jgi:hypothetical protein
MSTGGKIRPWNYDASALYDTSALSILFGDTFKRSDLGTLRSVPVSVLNLISPHHLDHAITDYHSGQTSVNACCVPGVSSLPST